jgi:hypothetical protein
VLFALLIERAILAASGGQSQEGDKDGHEGGCGADTVARESKTDDHAGQEGIGSRVNGDSWE